MTTIDINKERAELTRANTMLDDVHFSMPRTFPDPFHCCAVIWSRAIAVQDDPAVFAFDTGSNKTIEIFRTDSSLDWFMVPLAAICSHPNLIYNMLSSKEDYVKSYAGMFKIRLYNGGKWVEILIDDRLPFHSCTNETTPYFVTTDSGYWLPLVLKAFAKFHGSYGNLLNGKIEDAFQAFTSGVTETIELNNLKPRFHVAFIKYFESGCMMLLKYVYTTDNATHASYFAVTDWQQKETSADVSRVKESSNFILKLKYVFTVPKGKSVVDVVTCPKLFKLLMNLNSRDNADGAYWMAYADVVRTFALLYVCNLDWGMAVMVRQPQVKLESYKFSGVWYAGASAHSLRDPASIPFWAMPQFKFELREPDKYLKDTRCEFLISLQQPGHLYDPSLEQIGFFIFKLVNELERIPVGFKFFCMYRPLIQVIGSGNTVSRRLKLPVGVYLVVAVAEPENQNNFFLRVYTEAKFDVWGHVPRTSRVPSPEKKPLRSSSRVSSVKRVSKELTVTPTPSQIMMTASLAYKDYEHVSNDRKDFRKK